MESYENFIVSFTEYLYLRYRIPSSERWPTEVSSRKCPAHHTMRDGRHVIIYTRPYIARCVYIGHFEYDSIAPLWGDRNPIGYEALYRLALHEFAHVLQRRAGGRKYRSVHNKVFAAFLCKLIREVSFDTARAFIRE